MKEVAFDHVQDVDRDVSPRNPDGDDAAVVLCHFESVVVGRGGARGDNGSAELPDVSVRQGGGIIGFVCAAFSGELELVFCDVEGVYSIAHCFSIHDNHVANSTTANFINALPPARNGETFFTAPYAVTPAHSRGATISSGSVSGIFTVDRGSARQNWLNPP